jgi:hypothetical protein
VNDERPPGMGAELFLHVVWSAVGHFRLAVMAALVTAMHADGRSVVRRFGRRSGKPWILKGLQWQAQLSGLCCGMAAWMAVISTAMTQTVIGCF